MSKKKTKRKPKSLKVLLLSDYINVSKDYLEKMEETLTFEISPEEERNDHWKLLDEFDYDAIENAVTALEATVATMRKHINTKHVEKLRDNYFR